MNTLKLCLWGRSIPIGLVSLQEQKIWTHGNMHYMCMLCKGYVKNSGESVICKPMWGASKETNLADTFISGIQLEDLGGKKLTNSLNKTINGIFSFLCRPQNTNTLSVLTCKYTSEEIFNSMGLLVYIIYLLLQINSVSLSLK